MLIIDNFIIQNTEALLVPVGSESLDLSTQGLSVLKKPFRLPSTPPKPKRRAPWTGIPEDPTSSKVTL